MSAEIERTKFETGFSGSHLSAEEMRAELYTSINKLRNQLKHAHPGRRFRFKLEVHEI